MPPRKSTKKKSTKKRSTTQKGKGVLGDIHNFVRDNQLISKGVLAAGHPEIAKVVGQLGYGRKKRSTKKAVVVLAVPVKKRATRKKRSTQKGRGFFDSIGKVLGSVGHGVGSAGYGLLSGLTGGGRSATAKRNVLKF